MSAYSFWCSRCKFDHPGECATKTTVKTSVYPAIGSRWRPEVRGSHPNDPWLKSALMYEVCEIKVDTREVGYRRAPLPGVMTSPTVYHMPVEAWDPGDYTMSDGHHIRFLSS